MLHAVVHDHHGHPAPGDVALPDTRHIDVSAGAPPVILGERGVRNCSLGLGSPEMCSMAQSETSTVSSPFSLLAAVREPERGVDKQG